MVSFCIKNNDRYVLNRLYQKVIDCKLSDIQISKHSFKIYHNIIIHYTGKNIEGFYEIVSKIISEIIISFFEPYILERIINLNYFYFSYDEKRIIIDEFKLIKEKNVYDSMYVLNLIFPIVYNYLVNNKSVILSGFVNFCLPAYYHYLEKLVVEAVNQYIVDKEYITFVNLLRGYVNSKLPNNIIVNLIYVNSSGILLSDNGNYIKLDGFNSSYVSDISFSQNDYIINTLVGILPSEIRVHLISPEDQFIKTIEMIFTDKVLFCEGCDICKAYKLLHLQ